MTRLPAPPRSREASSREVHSGSPQTRRWRGRHHSALRWRWLGLGTAAAALGATALFAASMAAMPVSAAAESVSPDDALRLTYLVRQDCGSCHGLTLRGGLGKPLTAAALDHWDRDQLAAIILDGVPGTPMPPWRPLLTEREARWIADRLKKGELQ